MTVCFKYGYGCPTICEREVEIVAINFVYDLPNMPNTVMLFIALNEQHLSF